MAGFGSDYLKIVGFAENLWGDKVGRVVESGSVEVGIAGVGVAEALSAALL